MEHRTINANAQTLHTIRALREAFVTCGAIPAWPEEIAEAHDLAARLIEGKIATAATLARVHARTGAGVFVVREEGLLTGVLALVMLSDEGREAVWRDEFDAICPADRHVVRRGGEPAAVYGWGVAASNHEAAKKCIKGYLLASRTAVPHLAFFGRPVTAAGRRLMFESLGFAPVPGSTSGLTWIEPVAARQSAAA
ncbi:MAG TPA: hypothetical protein VN806_08370 [Caulobacteraceae bacterium]|nr:hypothetical protein [Caulobacteraceae bacterium]